MSKKKSKKKSKKNPNTNYRNNKADVNKNISNNSDNRPKVKKEDSEQSQLKSVKQTMNKIQSGNSKPHSKESEADDGKFMDFSKIDEEYKGELRRTLTPKERFFRTCEKFGDLFLLNVFFTITSLPIVTIGASFTALYTITFKMVRNEETTIKDGYFKAFKRNFKQSTQLWVGLMIVFFLIYLQLKNVMSTDSKLVNLMVCAIGFQMLILTFIVPLLFPMVARYENTNFNMIKNTMLASFLYLGTWATVFSLWVIPIILYYLKPTLCFYTWYLWFVFFTAFVAYTCSFRLRNMFDKIEEDPMEKAVEELKQNEG